MNRIDLTLRLDADCWTWILDVDENYYASGYAPTFEGARYQASAYIVNLVPEASSPTSERSCREVLRQSLRLT